MSPKPGQAGGGHINAFFIRERRIEDGEERDNGFSVYGTYRVSERAGVCGNRDKG
jgi:hypothetical protein